MIEFGEIILVEVVELKSKMYSIKKNKKRVSIAIEFNKFKDVLFGKKNYQTQMKRIQSKTHKIGNDN